MEMIAPQDSDTNQRVHTDEPTHVVCDCQWTNVPRYALCGADVTNTPEGATDTACVVCAGLTPAAVAAGGRCERCAPREGRDGDR